MPRSVASVASAGGQSQSNGIDTLSVSAEQAWGETDWSAIMRGLAIPTSGRSDVVPLKDVVRVLAMSEAALKAKSVSAERQAFAAATYAYERGAAFYHKVKEFENGSSNVQLADLHNQMKEDMSFFRKKVDLHSCNSLDQLRQHAGAITANMETTESMNNKKLAKALWTLSQKVAKESEKRRHQFEQEQVNYEKTRVADAEKAASTAEQAVAEAESLKTEKEREIDYLRRKNQTLSEAETKHSNAIEDLQKQIEEEQKLQVNNYQSQEVLQHQLDLVQCRNRELSQIELQQATRIIDLEKKCEEQEEKLKGLEKLSAEGIEEKTATLIQQQEEDIRILQKRNIELIDAMDAQSEVQKGVLAHVNRRRRVRYRMFRAWKNYVVQRLRRQRVVIVMVTRCAYTMMRKAFLTWQMFTASAVKTRLRAEIRKLGSELESLSNRSDLTSEADTNLTDQTNDGINPTRDQFRVHLDKLQRELADMRRERDRQLAIAKGECRPAEGAAQGRRSRPATPRGSEKHKSAMSIRSVTETDNSDLVSLVTASEITERDGGPSLLSKMSKGEGKEDEAAEIARLKEEWICLKQLLVEEQLNTTATIDGSELGTRTINTELDAGEESDAEESELREAQGGELDEQKAAGAREVARIMEQHRAEMAGLHEAQSQVQCKEGAETQRSAEDIVAQVTAAHAAELEALRLTADRDRQKLLKRQEEQLAAMRRRRQHKKKKAITNMANMDLPTEDVFELRAEVEALQQHLQELQGRHGMPPKERRASAQSLAAPPSVTSQATTSAVTSTSVVTSVPLTTSTSMPSTAQQLRGNPTQNKNEALYQSLLSSQSGLANHEAAPSPPESSPSPPSVSQSSAPASVHQFPPPATQTAAPTLPTSFLAPPAVQQPQQAPRDPASRQPPQGTTFAHALNPPVLQHTTPAPRPEQFPPPTIQQQQVSATPVNHRSAPSTSQQPAPPTQFRPSQPFKPPPQHAPAAQSAAPKGHNLWRTPPAEHARPGAPTNEHIPKNRRISSGNSNSDKRQIEAKMIVAQLVVQGCSLEHAEQAVAKCALEPDVGKAAKAWLRANGCFPSATPPTSTSSGKTPKENDLNRRQMGPGQDYDFGPEDSSNAAIRNWVWTGWMSGGS